MSIKERGLRALSLSQYDDINEPELVSACRLPRIMNDVHVLRMLIKTRFSEFKIPQSLSWVEPMINISYLHQINVLNIRHPFCYLTIRQGLGDYFVDNDWHVDGFSQSTTHLPEQNYLWCNKFPTEYVSKRIPFPHDFDTDKHNIHLFIQEHISAEDEIKSLKESHIYCIDPYVIHRKPKFSNLEFRTFIRVSFTQVEIADVNNTINPLIETGYTRYGVKELRDKLVRYERGIK